MNTECIRRIITKRENTDDEWQQGIEQCWEQLASALASDYDAARVFLLEDCTAGEAAWVSEVYDEIIQKTNSRKFIELLEKSIERFPRESEVYNMRHHLNAAIDSYYSA